MEKSLARYIWNHTSRQQIWVLSVVLLSMIPYYVAFDLPKQIVNGPLQGGGFDTPGATQMFLRWTADLPILGHVVLFPGLELDRIGMLIALSGAFLLMVVVNGFFKLYINTYKGRLGERLLRRIRYELVDQLLRFPPARFRRLKAAEAASMIKDEVEPLGGFAGDAFVQPLLLGGQALAALVFIFAQNMWLGAVAGGIAAVQVAIIPKMRRRLIRLGRERQLTARQLSGRVNEIIDGIVTVHALDTSNYERADISDRLGRIFRIRYDLYQWKFMVKFLNNFLAQVTPFVFYLLGGWLAIKGTLDVGQLVAVINAYKELPGPLKELIDWDQSRQDVEVKYEQVVSQFRGDDILPPAVQTPVAGATKLPGPIGLGALVVEDDSGNMLLDHVQLSIGLGETVALVDDQGAGAEALGAALGRAVWPDGGRLVLGDMPMLDLPESVSGRQISYVPTEGYFFDGSLRDNLIYGLRHAPEQAAVRMGTAARSFRWAMAEAKAAGNPTFDTAADWIDRDTVPMNEHGQRDLTDALLAALKATEMVDDVIDFGLLSHIDPQARPRLAAQVVELRQVLRADIDAGRIKAQIVPFERDRYNEESTISENLLFGTLDNPQADAPRIIQSPQVRDILMREGIATRLYDLGYEMVSTILELLGEGPGNEMILAGLPFIEPEDIPDLRQLIARSAPGGMEQASSEDRLNLIRMSMFYVEPAQRFGLMTDELMAMIVAARAEIQREMPAGLRAFIEPYDPTRYMRAASLVENIVFGKIHDGGPAARQEIRAAVLRAMDEAGLTRRLIDLGLELNVGVGGRRLSVAQRQKLNIARVLIRESSYYVFNKSLSAVEPRTQERIVQAVMRLVRDRGENATVIWVLTNTRLAHLFGRIIVFDKGRIRVDGSFEDISGQCGPTANVALS